MRKLLTHSIPLNALLQKRVYVKIVSVIRFNAWTKLSGCQFSFFIQLVLVYCSGIDKILALFTNVSTLL